MHISHLLLGHLILGDHCLGSKNLSGFYDKPIFDEYMNAHYVFVNPRHTFERTFTFLEDSYEVILLNLLTNELLALPKSSSYVNIF